MALILMRHTRPDVADGICYGATDLAPGPGFAAEAAAALAALPRPARIVTSPLTRCARLADLAARRFGLTPVVEPRLREMDFGAWEGRAWSDLPRTELDAWAADFFDARPHGGETVRELQARVLAALADLGAAAAAGAGPTLAVTHAGVLKVAASAAGHPDAWRLSVPFGTFVTHG